MNKDIELTWEALKEQKYAAIFASGLFDHSWYLQHYSEATQSRMPALEHFLKYGWVAGYKPNARSSYLETSDGDPRAALTSFIEDCESSVAPGAQSSPLVSVICITYNQEDYIEQALTSILAQDTEFEFEVLVGDDRSTDNTTKIVRNLAANNPRIRAHCREVNLGPNANLVDLGRRVRGRYVAICEGDDFWSDTSKLQRQVNYLEANPHVSVCFHPVTVLVEGYPELNDVYPKDCEEYPGWDKLTSGNQIQTNSVVYRWRYSDKQPFNLSPDLLPGDWFIHMLHMEVGRTRYIDRVMAVYRKHSGGIWASHTTEIARHRRNGRAEIKFFREAEGLFGGLYAEKFRAAQTTILGKLIDSYVDEPNVQALEAACGWDDEITGRTLATLGFDLSPEAWATGEGLIRALREKSRVSVIVTSYNHEATIERCLRSIEAQMGLPVLEVIISDDCSSDGTPDRIREFVASTDMNVIVVQDDKNVGMLANIRRCIDRATSPYVAFCEGDDYWLSNHKLQKQTRSLQRYPAAGLVFNWVLLHHIESDAYLPHPQQAAMANGLVPFATLADAPLTANFSCCLYRRSVLDHVPLAYYQGLKSADWLFNLYVANHSEVLFHKELLSVYTIHAKGQWSGLPATAQQAAIRRNKAEYELLFGRGRGFTDVETHVVVTAHASQGLDELVIANLDRPMDGMVNKLLGGCLTVSGWIICPEIETVLLKLSTISGVVTTSCNLHRPDVVNVIFDGADQGQVNKNCGFSVQAPSDWFDGLRLSIILSGQEYDWLSIAEGAPMAA